MIAPADDGPSDKALAATWKAAVELHSCGSEVVETIKYLVDQECARRAAKPVLRWLGGDRFEVDCGGELRVIRNGREGAYLFAQAVERGPEWVNAMVDLLEDRDQRLGRAMRKQRTRLAGDLEARGMFAAAAAVRRLKVRERDGVITCP